MSTDPFSNSDPTKPLSSKRSLEFITPRSYRDIAHDIEMHFRPIDHNMVPYLVAMKYIKSHDDIYMDMTAERIVRRIHYFTRGWKIGPGRLVRAELRLLLRQWRKPKQQDDSDTPEEEDEDDDTSQPDTVTPGDDDTSQTNTVTPQ